MTSHDNSTDFATPASEQLEIEWQYDALDLRPVENWLLGGHSFLHFTATLRGSKEQRDTYFDTDDWRFHRAGFVLRVRQVGGGAEATMKALAAIEDDMRSRREISQTLAADGDVVTSLLSASGPVSERVRQVAGKRPIRALFEVHNSRRKIEVALDGEPAGEAALDDVTVPVPGGHEPLRLRRVEVEAPAEMVAALKPVVDAMRAANGLQPAALSKFGAGLLAMGLRPAEAPEFGPTAVDASQTLAEAAFAVLRRHFTAFVAHEPGTRLGDDPEELHDMRVAARRLRAAMRLFEAALPARAERLNQELRWIAGSLGEVRDLDVQLEQLKTWQAEMQADEQAALASLLGVVDGRRTQARRRLLQALDSRRYERLVNVFGALLRRGAPRRPRNPAARALVAQAASPLITQRYRKVRKRGKRIGPDSAPGDYHTLRIQGKRLRYALEFFKSVYGKPAEKLIARLVDLQDLLGQHQDAFVAIDQLRALAASQGRRLPPEALFVMGGLAQRYAQQAVELRAQFPDVFKQFQGQLWKKLQGAMERQGQSGSLAGKPQARTILLEEDKNSVPILDPADDHL